MVPKLIPPTSIVARTNIPFQMKDTLASPEEIMLPPSPPLTSLEATEAQKDYVKPLPALPEVPQIPTTPTTSMLVNDRPRSPGQRGHLRSSSSNSASSLPPMQRAHSSPGVDSTGRYITPGVAVPRRPSSPLGYYSRRRSPSRSTLDDTYPSTPSWSGLNIEPNIPEHAELDLSSLSLGPLSTVSENDILPNSPLPSTHNTFPRSRRRPTSPLHQSASAPSLHARAASPHSASGSTSPSLSTAQKYANEPYPIYSFSSASSMPSTPTSLRSRSPSISSLETIEDIPDAEEAAMIEDEELAKVRAEDGDLRRRSSLELRSGSLRSNKERKRWSVCGAERRADFSLEPIEE